MSKEKELKDALFVAFSYLTRGTPHHPNHICGDPNACCDCECVAWARFCQDLDEMRKLVEEK